MKPLLETLHYGGRGGHGGTNLLAVYVLTSVSPVSSVVERPAIVVERPAIVVERPAIV
jgi:hypothetical protein